ncbi:MAG: hypothetical protein DWI57_13900 [Chloroflexi bacterium]|nr:MAG: hypothetical protein DWI57_13900 [Chloroflexota bacterium]
MPTATTTNPPDFWESHPNPHLRRMDRNLPASAVLLAASQRQTTLFRIVPRAVETGTDNDYTQIDPTLPLAKDSAEVVDPLPNTSYAGMTPGQRRRFANWLTAPEMAAPVAYRQNYLAWLETALFEEERQAPATAELFSLLGSAGWRGDSALVQAALLAAWLAQDPQLIAQAIRLGDSTAGSLAAAAGWLARLGGKLDAGCGLALARGWHLHLSALATFHLENDGPLLDLRITSLANSLGMDPLAWAMAQNNLAQSGETAGEWRPWRTAHRDIRLLLPQIDIRAGLEPRLVDLFASLPVAAAHQPAADVSADVSADDKPGIAASLAAGAHGEWQLILELGNNRSQHYDYVLHIARKQPGYQVLLDETRQLIHRIHFRKRHIRQFWRLWAYVEKWPTVHVYVNGKEIEKWNVYPYSAELR